MTIGIMAALRDEITDLLAIIETQEGAAVRRIGMRNYYVGKIEGQDCVIVVSRIGKVAAAATAVSLIREFGVNEIVFTGVAGGLAQHVNVGDIVVASQLIQHDMDARPIFPRHEIPLLGVTRFTAAPQLSLDLKKAATEFLTHDHPHQISREFITQFGLGNCAVHVGMIASGDQFIGGHNAADKLREELPDVFAVEMEGAAVAQICHEFNVPCAIIRTISDRADATAHIDFPLFLTNVASKYSNGMLRRFLASRLEACRQFTSSIQNPPVI